MSNFEFCKTNFLNTTTLVTVDSGTSTVDALFDRTKTSQYQSSGFNDDTAGVTITVEFPSSRNINRIALQNINMKAFKIYHSSNSANTLTLTGTSDTTVSDWTGNSATAKFLMFSTVAATSISIVSTVTIDANEEKKIGELWLLEKKFSLEDNPDAKSYKVKLDRREFIHEMAGGGWSQYILDEYFSGDIRFNFRSVTETSNFLSHYVDRSDFVFTPFPTATGWQATEFQQIYECIWIGDYEFLQPAANNYVQSGFKGRMRLRETPR